MLRRILFELVFLAGIAAGLVALVAGAWQLDTRLSQRDTIRRNVTVAGVSVGGLGAADLDLQLGLVAAEVAAEAAVVRTPDRSFTATSADLGVSLDTAALADAAWAASPGSETLDDFRAWVDSFFTPTDIEPMYRFDETELAEWVVGHPDRVEELPTEPTFTGRDGPLVVMPGVDGLWLEPGAVAPAVGNASDAGAVPVDVDVAWSPLPPVIDEGRLDDGLAEAARLIERPVTVRVADRIAQIGRETIRRWIDSRQIDDAIVPVLDPARVQQSLVRILEELTTEGTPPVFSIVDDAVAVELGEPPLRCCATGAGDLVVEALENAARGAVDLPLVPAKSPDEIAAEYGITQLVGEFTTRHACCQGRVRNNQRMADIVRGAVIAPGGRFSLNGYVGERTRERGFVPAGTIIQGRLIDTVGGGVSQFATTTFNAAFFAGMDFIRYQSHSIYISRYPYGREATVNYPDVDLEIENNTPYHVLIWTSYEPNSITVQMWSTPYYEVEQTRQTRGRAGFCTRVRTFRQRTDPLGRVLEDSVFATYRPGEGLDCAGNPTPRPRP